MKQIPLYEQIYREILGQIQNGTYRTGDKLPSEKELSEHYHVSRITSKKAVELLADAGIVVRTPGKGTFVSEQADTAGNFGSGAEEESVGRMPVIGVIMDGFGPDFGCRMLESIESECQQQGISMLLRCSYGKMEEETRAIGQLRRLGAEGILIMCVHDENYNASILRMVVEHYPVVTLDRQLKGIPVSFVGTDNERAAKELAGYLLEKGFHRICFVKPYAAETSTIQERTAGFRAAHSEYGMVADESLWITDLKATLPMYHGEEQVKEDMEKVMRFITEHPEIDSYFAVEYSLARIIYSCLKHLGKERDCPVVCFDGTDNIMKEAMFTHAKQDEVQIGKQGVQLLAEAIRGKNVPRTVQVPYRIIEATEQTTKSDDTGKDR